ncbi:MAG: hypothetical protein HZC42_01935 [Candidatus Eisenbacteria bacterium]|nr:hypothetical protein [Candidatus Eisenbacteria bacterium]
MIRRVVAVLALAGLATGLLAGCSPKRLLVSNLPPETMLFVSWPDSTVHEHAVNHVVHLYWSGSDPDGWVTGFDICFARSRAIPPDSAWTFTTRTDSLFTVPTPTGRDSLYFQVRAVDDKGQRDPQPAVTFFDFTNQPPTVSLVNRFLTTDTTFASATAQWQATDVDGDAAKMRFRVWLDGNEASPDLVSGSSFTFPTAQFLQGGQLLPGFRTMYVQAVDDGGRVSPVDSARWYVRAPATGGHTHYGRLLIVDDLPASNPANRTTDSLYTNTAVRNLPAGSWSVLRLETTQPFRSSQDVLQTFQLFDAVVWYIGGPTTFSWFETLLQSYEGGIAAYLDAGGSWYVDGLDLVAGANARGPLGDAFLRGHLGSDVLIQRFDLTQQDSSSAWGIRASPPAAFYVPGTGDSLGMIQVPTSGLRAFALRDAGYLLVRAPAGMLSQVNPLDYPVAVSVPQAAGGRLVMLTFPLRAANGRGTAPRFLAYVFQQMGLTGP